jgi:disulfide bond formation protein DsbB
MPSLSIRDITPWRAAIIVLIMATATIVGAWIFQFSGIVPCELCLKERWLYYAGIPLAALVAMVASRGPRALVRPGLLLLALVFAGSAVFGLYHAGVEWHFWQGPTDCTGALSSAPSVDDFLQQLQDTKIVQCDVVQIRILGLSLAGWNGVISAAMCAAALAGAWSSARQK